MANGTTYEVLTGSAGLAELGPAWRMLEEAGADHIFQTHAYADLWQRTVGGPSGAEPILVALREDDRVAGILPACRVRQNGIPILTWLGAPLLLDYGDVLYGPDAPSPVGEFVDTAVRLAGRAAGAALLYLPNVRGDARAFAPLANGLRTFRTSSAPFVEVRGSWEEYLAGRGRDLRYELNRRTRRLEEAGEVTFALLGPGDTGVEEAIGALAEFQRSRFAAMGRRTTLFDERVVRFRAEQATTEAHSRVATLSLDGRIIAVSQHAAFRGRLYCFAPGFDDAYAKFSPGVLLRGHVIRACFENGWHTCDFGWGSEAYKYRWTDTETTLTTFVGRGLGGAVMAAGAGARAALRDALGRP